MFHVGILPSAEFSGLLDLSTTPRESEINIGQLLQSGYKVFSVWPYGVPAVLEQTKLEMNEGIAALPGISGHVLEFEARIEIHPQAGRAAAARSANRGRERFHYWGLLIWTCFRRPFHFPLAVALAIYGYHFRKTCRVLGL